MHLCICQKLTSFVSLFQTNYVCTMDAIEVDTQIPQLTKDIRDIEEVSSASLSTYKFR